MQIPFNVITGASTGGINGSYLMSHADNFKELKKIIQALYCDDTVNPVMQKAYEDIHEQYFGRKSSATGAMSSVLAY